MAAAGLLKKSVQGIRKIRNGLSINLNEFSGEIML